MDTFGVTWTVTSPTRVAPTFPFGLTSHAPCDIARVPQ